MNADALRGKGAFLFLVLCREGWSIFVWYWALRWVLQEFGRFSFHHLSLWLKEKRNFRPLGIDSVSLDTRNWLGRGREQRSRATASSLRFPTSVSFKLSLTPPPHPPPLQLKAPMMFLLCASSPQHLSSTTCHVWGAVETPAIFLSLIVFVWYLGSWLIENSNLLLTACLQPLTPNINPNSHTPKGIDEALLKSLPAWNFFFYHKKRVLIDFHDF